MAETPKTISNQGMSHIYQGSLPDPDILQRYKNIDPAVLERIISMAEEHNKADVKTKNRLSLANLIIPIIGQFFTLLLGSGGILACLYFAESGYNGEAIAVIVGSFSPIVINALKGFWKNKE